MRPPYDPSHVEAVIFPRFEEGEKRPSETNTSVVVARCSCGWSGDKHSLGVDGTARALATDLNRHRVTYVEAESA